MNIIAVNRYYRPDHSATSQMLTDLAEHLATRHEVVVLTSRLLYDDGDRLVRRERLGGVSVRRLWSTRMGRRSLAGRALDYATFYLSAFVALLRLARRGDTVIVLTDPPLLSVAAAMAGRIRGFRVVNWCQDLFPEVAQALGMKWAGGWAGRVLRAARDWSLRSAVLNASLHERMSERLRARGVPADKIGILPNWADADIRPIAREDNPLRQAWGLSERFVIGYSGNLGRAHLPDLVAELVDRTKDIEGLTWLFIGAGAGIERVRKAAQGASNVIFKPYQSRDRLSDSLSAPDLHLISLDPACEGYVVPSKLYGVRAAGRPVLFLGAADGAVAREVTAHQAGVVLDPSTPGEWRGAIERAMREAPSSRPGLASSTWRTGWRSAEALSSWEKQLAAATCAPAATFEAAS